MVNRALILNNSLHIEILWLMFIFSAMYPVLEVQGGVEQQGGEAPSSPRPVTPQTPNTPLSPQGEELPQPQPLLDFDAQLPTSASQVCLSVQQGDISLHGSTPAHNRAHSHVACIMGSHKPCEFELCYAGEKHPMLLSFSERFKQDETNRMSSLGFRLICPLYSIGYT